MIMPETHRENRHRGDTAQRKSCQTVQKADINTDSLPDRKFTNQKSREFPALRLLLVFQVVASRCASRRLNKDALALPEPRGAAARIDAWTVSI
jgi:hypothetical protein